MTEQGVVEAALYSAGKALAAEEIAATTGLPVDTVRACLGALTQAYEARGSAIEVARIGDKWTMQIRASYVEKAQTFAPPEIPMDLLKTAALIAYHQPVRQSELVRMVGSKAYEHVRTLTDLNLLTTRPEGQTLELRTSAGFPEFFGLAVGDREEMKRLLAERAGVPPPKGSPVPPTAPADAPAPASES